MPITPDYDLLAAKYLDCQEAGVELRRLAHLVATWRRNNPAPGQRRARKADLAAVASAALRLRKALARIDIGTQAEALDLGIAKRRSSSGTTDGDAGAASEPDGLRRLTATAEMLRLEAVVQTVAAGFAARADAEQVVPLGGRPVRHDALLMGLEGLEGLWRRHRADAPSLSENERGFCALAIDLLAASPVGFDAGTVRNAVVDFLRKGHEEDKGK